MEKSFLPATPAPSVFSLETRFTGIHANGNATWQGKRVTVAGWRYVGECCESELRGLDYHRGLSLLHAMRLLDLALASPIRVSEVGDQRTVEVLGALGFTANLKSRSLYLRARNGARVREALSDRDSSLLPALVGTGWLAIALDVMGVAWRTRSGDTQTEPADEIERRFLDVLSRMLRADPRFRELRRSVASLLVDSELLDLAQRARIPSRNNLLALSHVQRVWRQLDAYREVNRRAPKLLPILSILHQSQGELGPSAEIMKAIKKKCGFASDAPGWRWMLRHGVDSMKWLLRDSGNAPSLFDLMRVVTTFFEAGFPPLPPPSFWRAWRTVNGPCPSGGGQMMTITWCHLPPRLRRLMLLEANERRRDPELTSWARQAAEAMFLIADPSLKAPTFRSDITWESVRRSAARRKSMFEKRVAVEARSWDSKLPERRFGNVLAVPLTDGMSMFDEGLAMKNCLSDCTRDCVDGGTRFFSLRDETGRRLAIVGLVRIPINAWAVLDVRRSMNRQASEKEWLIARALCDEYAVADGIPSRSAVPLRAEDWFDTPPEAEPESSVAGPAHAASRDEVPGTAGPEQLAQSRRDWAMQLATQYLASLGQGPGWTAVSAAFLRTIAATFDFVPSKVEAKPVEREYPLLPDKFPEDIGFWECNEIPITQPDEWGWSGPFDDTLAWDKILPTGEVASRPFTARTLRNDGGVRVSEEEFRRLVEEARARKG